MRCVEGVKDLVTRGGRDVCIVSRDELGRQHLDGVDLLVAVGGDGTVLSCSHFVDSIRRANQPWITGPVVVGINSDPTKPHEFVTAGCSKTVDERRSHGALCYLSANDMTEKLPQLLLGQLDSAIQQRTRMAVTIRSTLSETRLPPALNDILVAHPSPAAVSRFRLERRVHETGNRDIRAPQFDHSNQNIGDHEFSFNVWSSGLWVSTASGATAAMASAGGRPDIDPLSPELQYLVREHLIGETDDAAFVKSHSHGIVDPGHHLLLRWNAQHGNVWVDGHHTSFALELGDEVFISSHAMPLRLFSREARSREGIIRKDPADPAAPEKEQQPPTPPLDEDGASS